MRCWEKFELARLACQLGFTSLYLKKIKSKSSLLGLVRKGSNLIFLAPKKSLIILLKLSQARASNFGSRAVSTQLVLTSLPKSAKKLLPFNSISVTGLGWIWGPNGVNEIRANGMKLNFFFLFLFLFFYSFNI